MTHYSKAGVEALLREQPEVLDQLQRAIETPGNCSLRQGSFSERHCHTRAALNLSSGIIRNSWAASVDSRDFRVH